MFPTCPMPPIWMRWRPRPHLMPYASGGFPVPEAIRPAELPPEVQAAYLRLLEGPPKPAVTPAVMNEAQRSMIAPQLPFTPKA